jgi:glutamate---cysteine ligase / carboxylate-amine ligase
VIEHAFGNGDAFRVGIEEELLLVDSRSHRLTPVAAAVLERMDAEEGHAAHEAYAAEIELRGGPAASATEAAAELEGLRAAAREAGATLMGVGVHPEGGLGDAELVEAERYLRVLGEMRGLLQRTPECALHVHVGMPDPQAAVRAFNGMRRWLPMLAGLAAASPYWFGADSGMASSRAALVRAYPGRGVPPTLRDFDDYEERLSDVAAGGGPDDYTLLWWDVRLQPRLGTVEVRELDVQSRLGDVAAMGALVRGLAAHEAESNESSPPAASLESSSFRAARDGLDAEILHGERLAPLPEAVRDALELARPHARDAGDGEALEGIDRILREGGGAERQRAARSKGGAEELLELLIRETAEPM